MRGWSKTGGAVLAFAVVLATAGAVSAGSTVRAPLECSRGPGGQTFTAQVTAPRTAAEGSVYTVRVDSVPSGEISHTGLNYIHEMSTDYVLPPGVVYVHGSAHFVPRTGTPNVLPGARIWHENGMIRVVLPAHVDNGSSYTPPSIELQLRVTSQAGTELALTLAQIRVTANVFLLGDLHTECDPNPKPYVLSTTRVTPP